MYELGYHAAELIVIDLNDFRDVQERYDYFKSRALKLGVQLPDLTENALNLEFLINQGKHVEGYIDLHKTSAMFQLYKCGFIALLFFTRLNSGKKNGMKPTGAPSRLQDLIKSVKVLGVDLGDQLEVELKDICDNYMNLRFDQDIDSIRIELKKKVCGLGSEISNPSLQLESSTSTVYKRSEVDSSQFITDECWTVSLVRLPDQSNSEHAFIVLEGKTGGMSEIWFADFVAVNWFESVQPGTEEGKVRMKYYYSYDSSNRLLFKCQKRMMNVRASDRLLFSTWQIEKSAAQKLIQMIKAQREKPPKYHILGNNSVLARSSARSSSNPTGHNCFTFAKMILRDLNDPHIKLPEDGLETWISSATSRYLVDKQLTSRKWYKTTSLLLMFGFLASIVVAYLLYNTFYPKK